jgi:hypothetical protein
LWQRYLALLADQWFGSDREAGEVFLKHPGWPRLDPLMAAQDMAPAGEALSVGLHEAQKALGLPLIETERAAYVKSERGRLTAAMGAVYYDDAAGADAYFHFDRPEFGEGGGGAPDAEGLTPNPDDLSFEELARLTTLTKRVERLNTYSWFPFYPVQTEEKDRLVLLAKVFEAFRNQTVLGATEFAELLDGHDPFLKRLTSDGPIIIRPERQPE